MWDSLLAGFPVRDGGWANAPRATILRQNLPPWHAGKHCPCQHQAFGFDMPVCRMTATVPPTVHRLRHVPGTADKLAQGVAVARQGLTLGAADGMKG